LNLEIVIKKSEQGYYLYNPKKKTYLYAFYEGIIKPNLVIKESKTLLVLGGTVYFTLQEAKFVGKEYFKKLNSKAKIEKIK